MEVITIDNISTKCYLLSLNNGWLMVDTGMPDTFPQLLRLLSQKDIPVNDVNYLLVTHFHPEHAGLTQNLRDLGTELILHKDQISYVQKINASFKKNPKANFKDIVLTNNLIVSDEGSRDLLKSIGINGQIVLTPGHSEDSISLIVDGDCAFIGDLPLVDSASEEMNEEALESWEIIKNANVKTVYPAHGEPYTL